MSLFSSFLVLLLIPCSFIFSHESLLELPRVTVDSLFIHLQPWVSSRASSCYCWFPVHSSSAMSLFSSFLVLLLIPCLFIFSHESLLELPRVTVDSLFIHLQPWGSSRASSCYCWFPVYSSSAMSLFSSFLVLLLILVETANPTASSVPIIGQCSSKQKIVIVYSLIARLMGPTWGPSGADRTQVGPMLAPWTLLSGLLLHQFSPKPIQQTPHPTACPKTVYRQLNIKMS